MLKLGHKAPTKQILLLSKDKKFLSRLLLLHNNLMQYHNIRYEEVLIKFEHQFNTGDVIPTSEMLIYFEPTEIRDIRSSESSVYRIYNILDHYITTGLITKEDMALANEVWRNIRDKAK